MIGHSLEQSAIQPFGKSKWEILCINFQLPTSENWDRGSKGSKGDAMMKNYSRETSKASSTDTEDQTRWVTQPRIVNEQELKEFPFRYENKTNDMIWLELQAWFAGKN